MLTVANISDTMYCFLLQISDMVPRRSRVGLQTFPKTSFTFLLTSVSSPRLKDLIPVFRRPLFISAAQLRAMADLFLSSFEASYAVLILPSPCDIRRLDLLLLV